MMKDLNTSVIMSFFRKMTDFKRVLPLHVHYLNRKGIEVIIAMDEPTEYEELLEFVKGFPDVNWKIIVNEQEHEWRNPCKAWHVAIRHATKENIMVIDPECQMVTDAIENLSSILDSNYPCFTVGQVLFVDFEYHYQSNDINEILEPLYYGTIMAKRSDIERICGYTESYSVWGGEDDNLRAKLELIGRKKIEVERVLVLHREDDKDGLSKRIDKSSSLPKELFNKSFSPEEEDFINPNWGKDFNEIKFNSSLSI